MPQKPPLCKWNLEAKRSFLGEQIRVRWIEAKRWEHLWKRQKVGAIGQVPYVRAEMLGLHATGMGAFYIEAVGSMELSRRKFLALSGAGGAAFALEGLGFDLEPTRAYAQALKIEKGGSMQGAMVQFESAGAMIPAYLVLPDGKGPFSAVIVVHEIWGLVEHIKDVARRLAGQGYAAIAPDLYTREGGPPTSGDLQVFRKFLGEIPDRQIVGDLEAAFHYLQGRPDIRKEKIGIIGFCMGGFYALFASAQIPGLRAAVDFYGRLVYPELTEKKPLSPLDRAKNIRCPIQFHFGEADPSIPLDQVSRLKEILGTHGKTFELYTYPDAPHAFFNDTRDSYRPAAAQLAWQRTLAFFAKHLKG